MMVDPTREEMESALTAGERAGEYLDEIKKYDLSKLSKDEWHTFLLMIIDNYQRILREKTKDSPPF